MQNKSNILLIYIWTDQKYCKNYIKQSQLVTQQETLSQMERTQTDNHCNQAS